MQCGKRGLGKEERKRRMDKEEEKEKEKGRRGKRIIPKLVCVTLQCYSLTLCYMC